MGGGTITLKNDPAQIRKAFEYAKPGGFPLIVAAPSPRRSTRSRRRSRSSTSRSPSTTTGRRTSSSRRRRTPTSSSRAATSASACAWTSGTRPARGVDPVKTVDECQDRLLDVHVKDLKDKTNQESQTEVGKGALDIPGTLPRPARRSASPDTSASSTRSTPRTRASGSGSRSPTCEACWIRCSPQMGGLGGTIRLPSLGGAQHTQTGLLVCSFSWSSGPLVGESVSVVEQRVVVRVADVDRDLGVSCAARSSAACRSACSRRRGRPRRPAPSVPGSQAATKASARPSSS